MDKQEERRIQDRVDKLMMERSRVTAPLPKVPSKSMRITSPAKTEKR